MKQWKGSMTVEAVLLLPLLLVLLLLVFWLTLYLHDCVVVRSALQQSKESDGGEAVLEQYVENCLDGRLYLCSVEKVTVKASATELCLEAELLIPSFLIKREQVKKVLVIREEKHCAAREELTRIANIIIGWKDGEWAWK